MTSFVLGLLQICQEESSTASVEAIRNKAFEKLAVGEMKSLISSTVNGKSFNFNISMAADELFSQASEAIRLYNSGIIRSTEPDFSWINY
jgi:hypothetical protein